MCVRLWFLIIVKPKLGWFMTGTLIYRQSQAHKLDTSCVLLPRHLKVRNSYILCLHPVFRFLYFLLHTPYSILNMLRLENPKTFKDKTWKNEEKKIELRGQGTVGRKMGPAQFYPCTISLLSARGDSPGAVYNFKELFTVHTWQFSNEI